MDQFIARERIKLLSYFFERETDPSLRSRLKWLLIAEADKLGRNSEALDVIQTRIANGTALIKRQKILIASMEQKGLNTARARGLLNDLNETLLHFENCRQLILPFLDQSRL